ncbi:unnamed protein product [Effrenium voratum]|nr:unnamed protein product [Effrenium voratum]
MPRPSQRPSNVGLSAARAQLSLVLCPDLMVPDGVECTLNVPRLTLVKTNSRVTVTDSKGGTVFRVDFSRTPDREGTRLVLTNPPGDNTFASASDSRVMNRQAMASQTSAVSIISTKDQSRQYLLEDKTGGDYQVSSTSGQYIRFLSVPGGFNAIDDQDQLLAFLDPPARTAATTQVARIGPLVDAGLMVMCFMGIGVMKNDVDKAAPGR